MGLEPISLAACDFESHVYTNSTTPAYFSSMVSVPNYTQVGNYCYATIPTMAYESNAIFWIEVEKVVPNPYQPRREFDPHKLQELADSIRMYGVLQPLVVTRREIMRENGAFSTEYELIAGERRLRASKLAGLAQVPVIIRSGEESQLMKLELAIIENLQREDLNAVDRALAFKQLAEQFGLSHSQVAQKVGRSREYVSNSIRLLLLPETILGALRLNDITDGHARTLLMLNDRPEEQDIVFREILLKKLSVREVERIARKIATEKVRKKEWSGSDPELIEIEREFMETLGTRVQIAKTEFGGRVTIDYFSPEDLQKLLSIVHGTKNPQSEQVQVDENTKALGELTRATPLVTVQSSAYQYTSEIPPEAVETVFDKDEEVYTRFDSMEHMDTDIPHTEYTPSMAHPEVIAENTVVYEQPHVPEPLMHVAPIQEHVTLPPEKEEVTEDPDLYSIKNFSL